MFINAVVCRNLTCGATELLEFTSPMPMASDFQKMGHQMFKIRCCGVIDDEHSSAICYECYILLYISIFIHICISFYLLLIGNKVLFY